MSESFDSLINSLFDDIAVDGEFRTHSERVRIVDDVVEDYFANHGDIPSSSQLDRLSTYILKEDKKDRKGRKRPPAPEYPYLSDRQYDTRTRREASYSAAETYDSDGINRELPTRTNRITSELKTNKMKLR